MSELFIPFSFMTFRVAESRLKQKTPRVDIAHCNSPAQLAISVYNFSNHTRFTPVMYIYTVYTIIHFRLRIDRFIELYLSLFYIFFIKSLGPRKSTSFTEKKRSLMLLEVEEARSTPPMPLCPRRVLFGIRRASFAEVALQISRISRTV